MFLAIALAVIFLGLATLIAGGGYAQGYHKGYMRALDDADEICHKAPWPGLDSFR